MTCPEQKVFFAFLEQDLSLSKASEFEQHLRTCRKCETRLTELQRMTTLIGPDPHEFTVQNFAPMVLTKATQLSSASSKSNRILWWLPLPASLGLLLWLFLFSPWPSDHPDKNTLSFTSRGTKDSSPEQWISLQVYRPRESSPVYERLGNSLFTDDSLVFSIRNGDKSPYTHLMILGIQDSTIFWYYPEYQDPQKNPSSIGIRSQKEPLFLREEIRHGLSPGWLHLVGIFSKTPLDVLSMEKLVQAELSMKPDTHKWKRLSIENTGQIHKLLWVMDPASRREQ